VLASENGRPSDAEALGRVPSASFAVRGDDLRIEPWLPQPAGEGVEPGTWLARHVALSEADGAVGAAVRAALRVSRESHAAILSN
jgi:hypothetical protein